MNKYIDTLPRTIKLSGDNGYTIVDADNYKTLSKYKWAYSKGYARRHTSKEEKLQGLPGSTTMHRQVMGVMKDGKSVIVDHIAGDTLDNRRDNLRVCSQSENLRNVGLSSANKSGVKGVMWNKSRNKWTATIRHNKQTLNLGSYNKKKDAILARKQYEIDMGWFQPRNIDNIKIVE